MEKSPIQHVESQPTALAVPYLMGSLWVFGQCQEDRLALENLENCLLLPRGVHGDKESCLKHSSKKKKTFTVIHTSDALPINSCMRNQAVPFSPLPSP